MIQNNFEEYEAQEDKLKPQRHFQVKQLMKI